MYSNLPCTVFRLSLSVLLGCSILVVVAAQCGVFPSIVWATEGSADYFKSPGYPGPYHSNADCSWRLVATRRHVIQLEILELNLLQPADCVFLHDGMDKSGHLIARLCAPDMTSSTVGTFYHSSGIYMFIHFVSVTQDGQSQPPSEKVGFRFSYLSVLPDDSSSVLKINVALGALGGAVAAILLISIVCCCFCRCRRSQSATPTSNSNNIHDMDNPVFVMNSFTHVHASVNPNAGSRHARNQDSGESTLPPNYSDLSMREGAVSMTASSRTERSETENIDTDSGREGVEGESRGGGEGLGVEWQLSQESQIVTPPPQYSDAMINLFPPERGSVERLDSISPPSSPPPPPPSPLDG